MISSAVVIPEQPSPPPQPTPSPSLKRRQSSFDTEPAKRPRIDAPNTNDSALDYGSAISPSQPTAASSPRRKSSLISGAEEKKRGQRLFGGLLSTLSQKNASKPGSSVALRNQKREDIEKRQLERIKAQNEEREEERRRRREELAETRAKEQKRWDEQSRNLRWSNMRAMTGFLRTKTEPRLYYKPWELRDDEKEVIDRQRDDVEGEIEKEKAELIGTPPVTEAVTTTDAIKREDEVNVESNSDANRQDGLMNGDAAGSNPTADTNVKADAEEPESEMKEAASAILKPEETHSKAEDLEELVQGEEDDVIY